MEDIPMETPRSSSSDSLTDASLQSMEVESVLSIQNTPEPETSKSEADSAENSPYQIGVASAETVSDNGKPRLLGADEDIDDTSAIRVVHHGEDDEDDEDVVTPFAKRKRSSINYSLNDPRYGGNRNTPLSERAVKRTKKSPEVRGVIIGVWRDSSFSDDKDKHVIFGFIDIHDRLRTRIYPMNRRGEDCQGNIPVGAGGCWVTFPRVIFDSHLESLGAAEVKEYVKLRVTAPPDRSDEEREKADLKYAQEAVDIVAAQDASPIGRPPGPPRGPRKSLNRDVITQQSLTRTPSFKAVNTPTSIAAQGKASNADTKPNGVLLGYWLDSNSPRLEDKHAVYGVIGGSDCFRVKVTRTTRDGRYIDGNFPIGAGAMWLHYDHVVFDERLASLSRAEMKEYVRIRVRDMDGELEEDREANERRAMAEAQSGSTAKAPEEIPGPVRREDPEVELRHSSRNEHKRQQAESDAKMLKEAERVRLEKVEARERRNEETRKEVALAEAALNKNAKHAFQNDLKKLNRVWEHQQAVISRTNSVTAAPATVTPAAATPSAPVTSEDLKYYQGIKYERKNNGPFAGKLCSPAQLINIDGEDYVEYRILTKPSFF